MTPEPGWIVGVHAVRAALEAGRPLDLVWVQRGRQDRRIQGLIEQAAAREVPVRFVPRSNLERVAAGVSHNGIAARGAPRSFSPIESLVQPQGERGRMLLLDGITDPHNVGAMIRTAAAFGLDGVIVAGPGAPPLGGALAAAAAGQLERLPVARSKVAGDVLRQLREAGYWCFGADAAGTPVASVRPSDRWVLVLGSEGRGLRAKTRAFVDELLAVPIRPEVESLNVSVAAAVLTYALLEKEQPG
jgi:23S rRNA (guanosine2251-2'-O)-methyltransferase